jgi:hypothetical protein
MHQGRVLRANACHAFGWLSGLLDGMSTHPRLGLSVARLAGFPGRPSGGAGGSGSPRQDGRRAAAKSTSLANEDVSPPAFGCRLASFY